MEIEKAKYRIKCEMGFCRNRATHTIVTARSGIRSRINLCEECLRELAVVANEEVAPSEATSKKKSRGERNAKRGGKKRGGNAQEVEIIDEVTEIVENENQSQVVDGENFGGEDSVTENSEGENSESEDFEHVESSEAIDGE